MPANLSGEFKLSITVHPSSPNPDEGSQQLITPSWMIKSSIGIKGIETEAMGLLSITPLLTLGVGSSIATSWSYGEQTSLLGTYNMEKGKYDQDTPFTAYGYKFHGDAELKLPLSKKDVITGFYSLIYTGYTNASNGTPWGCGPICSEGYTNGLRFASGASYMHAIENKAIYAAGIMAQISRDRAFKADTYKPQQELSQKYTDPIWLFKSIGVIWQYQFH